jgi:lipopolysaccharide biosynthesis regulator YciM
LWRTHSNKAAFFALPLMKSWTEFLDRHEAQIEGVFGRLRGELLSQLGWEAQGHESADKKDLHTLLKALFERYRDHEAPLGWEGSLMRLLSLSDESSNALTVFSCGSCSELHRKFKWKCTACNQWDTVIPWNGRSALS